MVTTAVGASNAGRSVAAAKRMLVATASLRFCLWSRSTAANGACNIKFFFFLFQLLLILVRGSSSISSKVNGNKNWKEGDPEAQTSRDIVMSVSLALTKELQ
jgi:hypothetical protein